MINAVRDLRDLTGMSRTALGDALGVSRQTINSIETGKYDPSFPLTFAISGFFDHTLEEVFDDQDT